MFFRTCLHIVARKSNLYLKAIYDTDRLYGNFTRYKVLTQYAGLMETRDTIPNSQEYYAKKIALFHSLRDVLTSSSNMAQLHISVTCDKRRLPSDGKRRADLLAFPFTRSQSINFPFRGYAKDNLNSSK
jgi:hypothetical protein